MKQILVNWKLVAKELAARTDALEAENERLREALERIADPTYVGNYAPPEVVEIHRKWALAALAEGEQGK
jgi:hypothetical protein